MLLCIHCSENPIMKLKNKIIGSNLPIQSFSAAVILAEFLWCWLAAMWLCGTHDHISPTVKVHSIYFNTEVQLQHFYYDISQKYDLQEHQGKGDLKDLGFVYERKGKKLAKKSTGQDTAVLAHKQHLHADKQWLSCWWRNVVDMGLQIMYFHPYSFVSRAFIVPLKKKIGLNASN